MRFEKFGRAGGFLKKQHPPKAPKKFHPSAASLFCWFASIFWDIFFNLLKSGDLRRNFTAVVFFFGFFSNRFMALYNGAFCGTKKSHHLRCLAATTRPGVSTTPSKTFKSPDKFNLSSSGYDDPQLREIIAKWCFVFFQGKV